VKIDLSDTNASEVSAALVRARRSAGSPAMGMVLTLVVVTDEARFYDAMQAAATISTEHPARVLGLIHRGSRGSARLDAQVRIGNNTSGETLLLRLNGELIKHAESVALPLLLPDSPVVVWWPGQAPQNPAETAIGSLGKRRITDAAAGRARIASLIATARNYTSGDTDLSWTRLTPWRGLMAAALDQIDADVTGGRVAAARANPSAQLLAAWLESRLGVSVDLTTSKGPGITDVRLRTADGDVALNRADGRTGVFSVPGEADRPVALKRRTVPELLAEDLRHLDEDDIYAETVRHLLRRTDQASNTTSENTAKGSG